MFECVFFFSFNDYPSGSSSMFGDTFEHRIFNVTSWTGSRSIKVRKTSLFSVVMLFAIRHNNFFASRLEDYFSFCIQARYLVFLCRLTGEYMLIFIPGMVLYFAYFPLVKYMLNQVESNCHQAYSCLRANFEFCCRKFPNSSYFFL